MNNSVVLTLVVALVIGFTGIEKSQAQDVGLFNGNGIKNQWGVNEKKSSRSNQSNVVGMNATNVLGSNRLGSGTAESGKWKFPKFDFSKLKPNFQTPKFMQSENFPKALEFSDTGEDNFFSSFPKLSWPSRDPSQPNFFQRMNERSRQMLGNTRDSFSDFGQRSRNTWDSLTRGITGKSSSTMPNLAPAQPQLRSARSASQGSASKF